MGTLLPESLFPPLIQSPAASKNQNKTSSSAWISLLPELTKSTTSTIPISIIDGVAKVSIPSSVLEDAQPLWKKFVVGYFIGEAPHIGKVHATVNRIRNLSDRSSKIDAQYINPNTVIFKIDDDSMRARVLHRKYWHISDSTLVVQVWNPRTSKNKPDLSAMPIWVDFKKFPDHLFSWKGLMFLGDTVGKAQKLHPNTERCVRLDVARVLVLVNMDQPLPNSITIDDNPEISISVSYPWLPKRCLECRGWGHSKSDCGKRPDAEKMKVGEVVELPKTQLSANLQSNEKDKTKTEGETSHKTKQPQIKENKKEIVNVQEDLHSNSSTPALEEKTKNNEKQWTLVTRSGNKRLTQSPERSVINETPLLPSKFQILEPTSNEHLIEEGEIVDKKQEDPTVEEYNSTEICMRTRMGLDADEESVENEDDISLTEVKQRHKPSTKTKNKAKKPIISNKDLHVSFQPSKKSISVKRK